MAQTTDQLQSKLDEGEVPPPGVLTLVPDDIEWCLPDVAEDAPEPAHLRWDVRDYDGAEFAMSKLRENQAIRETKLDQASKWHRRIDAWLAGETREADYWIEFFGDKLERYAVQQRIESGDKVKSIKLPSGKVETRATAADPVARVKIIDPAMLVGWAQEEELEDLIKVDRCVLVTTLREHVKVLDRAVFQDGEIILDALIHDSDDGPVAVDHETGEILRDVKINEGPFVIHSDGMLVPGVEVGDVKVTATARPAS